MKKTETVLRIRLQSGRWLETNQEFTPEQLLDLGVHVKKTWSKATNVVIRQITLDKIVDQEIT